MLARARRWESAPGERFDLKEFHHVVLLPGAVLLNIRERNVDAWMAHRRGQG